MLKYKYFKGILFNRLNRRIYFRIITYKVVITMIRTIYYILLYV